MTDNEIIKALECCTDDSNGVTRCERCPYQTTDLDYCIDDLLEQALDLINRQQAEIERLQGRLAELEGYIEESEKDDIIFSGKGSGEVNTDENL